MDPLTFPTIQQGQSGPAVKQVQEWLNLRGFALPITSFFGSATEAAVADFCHAEGLTPRATVDQALFSLLRRPLLDALVPAGGTELNETVVALARQHLAQGPRAVGGPRSGPWVRLYLDGKEGASKDWGAGFVCHCLRRACAQHHRPLPFALSPRIERLTASAVARGCHLRGDTSGLQAGDLFVSAPSTGVVERLERGGFEAIEVDLAADRLVRRWRSFEGCGFLKVGL